MRRVSVSIPFISLVALGAACQGAAPAAPSAPTATYALEAARRGFPAFVPTPGVTPEGVAVAKNGDVYVSVRTGSAGFDGAIWKYTPAGERTDYAAVGLGTIGGLAITPGGDLYVAMAMASAQGVYRVDRKGVAERLPGTQAIVFPNALAFDERGGLYISESFSVGAPINKYGQGGIWRVARGGVAQLLLRHPLLTGTGTVLPYPVGANGIGLYHGDLYVVNTDKALVLRIPVSAAGDMGEPEVWAQLQEVPESPAAGGPFPVMGDGLALDVHGNVYVAVVSRNAVVRIDRADRSQHTIALLAPPGGPVPTAPFDTPASLAFGTGAGEQQSLFVTSLGWMASMVPAQSWPGPGLVKVAAGAPGLPLP